jgi:dihydroflavonol-4-reductase
LRVLLTGATGYIGSHTASALLERGHEVVALVRDPERLGPALDPHGVTVQHAVGSMVDADAVARAVAGCDAVVHTAGQISLAGAASDGATPNLDGARTVFGAAVEAGADPVVYTSTITAYLPTEDPTVDLDTPLAEPMSAYGAEKRDVELLARSLQDAGHPLTTLVLGGVYGPVSPHLDGSFGAVLGAIETLMLVPPGGMGVLDVRDTAAMLAAAVEPGRGPRRYMAGGRYVSWQEWTDLLSEAEGTQVAQQHVTREEMVQLGRDFDHQREAGIEVSVPLTEEAAEIMTAGVPTDDSATIEELGVRYRPTTETFADTIAWLRSTGRLPPR